MTGHQQSPSLWDSIATRYDGLRPDQGLSDPAVRAAWTALLADHLPRPPAKVLDVGCGTGSLSLLLAASGYTVTGIDFAPAMITEARAKAASAGLDVAFAIADASAPDFRAASFNVIVCRQVLWALPDPASVLRKWSSLLVEGGTLFLVEGLFSSGNGIAMPDLLAALPETLKVETASDLSGTSGLWGGPIPDQRYLVTAQRVSD